MRAANRRIQVEPLTVDTFHPFGAFSNLGSPPLTADRIGDPPIEFFRDMLPLSLGHATTASFSTCRVAPRPFIVDVLEYHTHTGETMMSLDQDMIVQVAPATPVSQPPPLNRLRAFAVPRGMMVMLRPGVWHHAPFATAKETLHVLVALPERTYANDCIVVTLDENDHVAIDMQANQSRG